MAPPKVAKKTPKSIEQPIEKPISKASKKGKKKSYENFSRYIYKVLKTTPANVGISKKSILIMNNFVADTLEKIAKEASSLAAHGKKKTLSIREIQSAIKLILPGELAKHANIEAMKAVTLYRNSQNSQPTS